jgi:metal-responsive CopG/Arc/MetJ family transcriptional regulator
MKRAEPEAKKMSHTIEVRISDDLLQRLDERVRARGGDRSDYIEELLAKDLTEAPHAGMTFAELLSVASGPSPAEEMSEAELTSFIESEVKVHRAEKRQKSPHG